MILKDSLKTIAVSLIILSLVGVVYAWTEPTQNAPLGNTAPPVNTSATHQIKDGGLDLKSLSVQRGSLFNSTVIMENGSQIQLNNAASTTVGFLRGVGNQIQFQNSGGVAKMAVDTSSGAVTMENGGQIQLKNVAGATVGFLQGVGNQIQFQNSGGVAKMTVDTSSGAVTMENGGQIQMKNAAGEAVGFLQGVGNQIQFQSSGGSPRMTIDTSSGAAGLIFSNGTKQTTAGSIFVTGTYVGNGTDNREIVIGFQPDDVEVGTVNPVAYSTAHRNKNMQTGYSQWIDSAEWTNNGIKSFTSNGFTIGTLVNVNEMSRTYWYKAFSGGFPSVAVTPTIDSLVISPNLTNTGQPTTISWSSSNAVYCVATGQWSGNKLANGSQSITPTTVGLSTYTLDCYNSDASKVAVRSATVTATNAYVSISLSYSGQSCSFTTLRKYSTTSYEGCAYDSWDNTHIVTQINWNSSGNPTTTATQYWYYYNSPPFPVSHDSIIHY